jgi:putative toxin-antitoxin system antitoxin component (TIGR02293 family)
MATAERELSAIEDTLAWLHDDLGLTYDQIGSFLNVSDRTLRRWRNHAHLPRERQKERIEDLNELRHVLHDVFPDSESREEWLHSPSSLLRGRTPISLLRKGQVSRVVDALATLASGAFV